MAFLTLEVILFGKKNQKYYISLPFFFFFVYLLPGLINEISHFPLSVFEGGAMEHIMSAKIWHYVFHRVFWHFLIDFLFVFLLFFTS